MKNSFYPINNLYVWGRNGRTTKGGLRPYSELQYLTSYTEVTNGEKGNGLIPGIYHDSSLTVTAKTYQFQLYDLTDTYIKDIPSADDLEMYITVFGKPKPTGVLEFHNKTNELNLFPNPSNSFLNIKCKIEHDCSPVISIYNSFGNLVYKENIKTKYIGEFNYKIETNELPAGIYTLCLNLGFS